MDYCLSVSVRRADAHRRPPAPETYPDAPRRTARAQTAAYRGLMNELMQ